MYGMNISCGNLPHVSSIQLLCHRFPVLCYDAFLYRVLTGLILFLSLSAPIHLLFVLHFSHLFTTTSPTFGLYTMLFIHELLSMLFRVSKCLGVRMFGCSLSQATVCDIGGIYDFCGCISDAGSIGVGVPFFARACVCLNLQIDFLLAW